MRVRQRIAEYHYRQGEFDEAVEIYQEIAEYYDKEDFVLKAIDTCKNVLKIKPDLVDVNLRLATLYLKVDMKTEASNQFRIAINHFGRIGDSDRALSLAQQLVQVDGSNENRAKLAEIYISCNMAEEAVKQYEILAKEYRLKKNYDKLLHYYELILPHRQTNMAVIRDLCILYLRKKHPDRALHIMEQYKVVSDPNFADLVEKARLMQEALRRKK
jgi:tetratricopeptide (TPR) repeat protein